MLAFSMFDGAESYPKRSYDGQDNQSYGFQSAGKLQTGTLRGTQLISSGDGSRIALGAIPGTDEFGIALFDAAGKMVRKIVATNDSFYNPVDNYNNSIRLGGAPSDGHTGIWVAKAGNVVSTLLGG